MTQNEIERFMQKMTPAQNIQTIWTTQSHETNFECIHNYQ